MVKWLRLDSVGNEMGLETTSSFWTLSDLNPWIDFHRGYVKYIILTCFVRVEPWFWDYIPKWIPQPNFTKVNTTFEKKMSGNKSFLVFNIFRVFFVFLFWHKIQLLWKFEENRLSSFCTSVGSLKTQRQFFYALQYRKGEKVKTATLRLNTLKKSKNVLILFANFYLECHRTNMVMLV